MRSSLSTGPSGSTSPASRRSICATPNSTQWCPALLKHGITATLGPVAEPYLHAFPEPKAFFGALFDGHCLVEAYYLTQPFNSWQLVLIGDPLYRPFKTSPAPSSREVERSGEE